MGIPEFKEGKVSDMDFSESTTGIENDKFIVKVGKNLIKLSIKEIVNFEKIWYGKPPAKLIGKTISLKNGIMKVVREKKQRGVVCGIIKREEKSLKIGK
jgi:hypothetical protein